jgi:hypothetical protein
MSSDAGAMSYESHCLRPSTEGCLAIALPCAPISTPINNFWRWCTSACATIYEYEEEAVESLVMGRLGLPCNAAAGAFDRPTDGLLTSSVARVHSTAGRICRALELEQDGSS